jgi:pentatricopeptide repeat protein
MNTLARGLARDGRPEAAVELLLELVERRTLVNGAEHSSTIRDQAGLLIGYLESRRYIDALALANEQLPLSVRIYGETHPATLTVYSLRGSAHKGLQDYPSAVADFRLAYEGYAAKFGAAHPHVIGTGYNVASSMALAGQAAEAERWLSDLAERAPTVFGADHPVVFDIQVALKRSRLEQGKLGVSEAELLRMHEDAAKRFAGHPREGDVRELLRLYYLGAGQAAEAARWGDAESGTVRETPASKAD